MASAQRRQEVRFTIRPLRWEEARVISRWHYDGPYAIYDMHMAVPMLTQALFRLFGRSIYFAARDETGSLVGFYSLMSRGGAVEIGLALRPDLTGKGLGLAFVQAGLAYARQAFSPKTFYLNVATFNERARRVYERAGFRPHGTFQARLRGREYEFLEMTREA
jgi:ribosomal-protein-alanine N-acetyltransferase